jgi:glutamate-1-semialdehyde 2,1-aminomutase
LSLLSAAEIARLNAEGDELRARLQALLDASPLRARVTGVGSLLQVHFTDADVADYRDGARADVVLAAAFHLALLLEGVFVAPRGMMGLSLPVRGAEVEETVSAADRALARLTRAGARR